MYRFQRLSSLLQPCSRQQLHTPMKIWNLTTYSRPCHLKSSVYPGSSIFHDVMPAQGLISVRPFASNIDDKATNLMNKVKPLGVNTQMKKGHVYERKPLDYDHAGDLEGVKPLVKDEILFGYKELDCWKDVPEELKKIFTLEFADGHQRMAHEVYKLEEQFSKVCGPFWNLEKRIAKDTVHVRHLIKHCNEKRRDIRSKVILGEKMAKRRKKLKELRKLDYERFMWLLKTLKIKFTPLPAYPKKISRKGLIKKAAREEAFAFRDKKLKELEVKVTQEYDKFKVFKEKELADIDKIVQEYGLSMEAIIKDIEPKERTKKKR